MLHLDDPGWADLRHAYGSAIDTPDLLKQLRDFPASGDEREPWYSLWSSLAHQNEVYPASFAAVPHVISALASNPAAAGFDYFALPSVIEICRSRDNIEIPPDLEPAYRDALAQLPELVAQAATRDWDSTFLASALSAVAAAKGFPAVAEVVAELEEAEIVQETLTWLHNR